MTAPCPYESMDCHLVTAGDGGVVIMRKDVTDEFCAAETKKQAKLLANMRLWARGLQLTEEQMNFNEGRIDGTSGRMLYAVKTRHVRLYCFVKRLLAKKTLVVIDIDTSKKRDKADPKILARAKKRAQDFDKKY